MDEKILVDDIKSSLIEARKRVGREIVRTFNSIYGETLVEPYLITPDKDICKRLPGTDGKNKMR